MKQFFLTFLTFFLIANSSFSQTSLKMTKTMSQYWDTELSEWSGWPDEWSYYLEDEEPIIKFTKLDDEGSEFLVEIWTPDYASFTVTYDGFNEEQDAHVYKDVNEDEVWIIGSTISELALNGWPDNTVQIYFWIYSDNYSLLLE